MAWTNTDSTYQSFTHRKAAAREAGEPELVGNTLCYPLTKAAANEDVTMVYDTHQVTADKLAGVAITAGDRLRVHLSGNDAGKVNKADASATNIACGFAREDAAAAATKVKIRFEQQHFDARIAALAARVLALESG